MRNLFLIVSFIIATNSFCQVFEGKIVYQNSYVSKIPNVSDEQLTTMMGSEMIYIVKGGNYKSSSSGTVFQWQVYLNTENRLYTKLSNSETVQWYDAAVNNDEVLSVEHNENVATILGYPCNELIFTCKSGKQKYYYSPKISVATDLYNNHLLGNWYEYLKHTSAHPLKSIMETSTFTLTSTATAITATKIDEKNFRLPEKAKTAQAQQ